MSEDFFDSPVVAEALGEIVDLQNQVLLFSTFGEFASIEQQRENLGVLRQLHAKQKNMCFRCNLSGDPGALSLMWEVLKHFESFGHIINQDDPLSVFNEVKDTLDEIEFELDYCEKHGFYPGEEPGGETPPSTMF